MPSVSGRARGDDRQDEAMAEALAGGISGASAGLVTKADLTSELPKLETRLTYRISVVSGLIVAARFAMLRFMP